MQVMNRGETTCQVMCRISGNDPEKCGYILVPRGPGAHQDIPVPKLRKTRKAVWVVLFTAAVTANLYRGHWENSIILGLFGLWFMCLAMKEA